MWVVSQHRERPVGSIGYGDGVVSGRASQRLYQLWILAQQSRVSLYRAATSVGK